jgi:hypothetical protein
MRAAFELGWLASPDEAKSEDPDKFSVGKEKARQTARAAGAAVTVTLWHNA